MPSKDNKNKTKKSRREKTTSRTLSARQGSDLSEQRQKEKRRLTTPDRLPEEMEFDLTLRPSDLDEFVGQEKLKEKIVLLHADVEALKSVTTQLVKEHR